MSQKQRKNWVPRSFQKEALKICLGQACCGLLLPPGAGKTSIIYMLSTILLQKKFVKRVLVICPIRPMYRVWPHQKDTFEEFHHLTVEVMHGPDKDEALLRDADIHVVNPDGLEWLFAAKDGEPDPVRLRWLADKFDMLVVDESTKFRNSTTKRFKLLKKFIGKFRRRYILTGTLRPKNLLDLFGQVYILDEGQSLGRYITHYRTNYFFPSGYGGYDWQPMPGAMERIAEKIAPLVYRRNLSDLGIDLPEIVWDDIYVDLPPAALRLYQKMEDELVAEMEGGAIVAENAAVASGKCRQIANGALIDTEEGKWRPIHDAKIEALQDLVEQLQGEPLLITYEFKADASRISDALSCPNISSGNAKRDDANMQRFSRGELPAVMGNPQSISLGIDGLQESCCHIAMVGITWKLEDYLQVIDRIRRQGNKSQRVWVHRILARNTLDERMVSVLDRREVEQEDFLELLRSLRQ